MVIRLTKHHDRPHTLLCIRDDRSKTFFTSRNNSDFFAVHDLTHFAVETVLGYRHAFYGLIADGADLNDFGTEHEPEYHDEALWAENLVNTLQLGGAASYEQFRAMLEMTYPEKSQRPEVNAEQFSAIVAKMQEVIGQWRALPAEGTLDLVY